MSNNASNNTTSADMAYSSLNNAYARRRENGVTQSHPSEHKKQQQPHNHDMTYHYAGKVHVRGLIRRVWRPRYLALGDDGYLRYHESVPPPVQQYPATNNYRMMSSSQNNNNSSSSSYQNMYNIHHTHRPKQILAILDGARTIDPNSVMDQHVALPEGVHGFVFRGRPVELSTSSQNHGDSSEMDATIVPLQGPFGGTKAATCSVDGTRNKKKQSKQAAVVNMVFPQGSSRRRAAQQIAKAAVNPDVLCGGFGSGGGGGVSRSSSSSSLMGYERQLSESLHSEEYEETGYSDESYDATSFHNEHKDLSSTIQVKVQASTVQSREYLCAVSTAEEAESWVVALKWAAEHRRRGRYAQIVSDGEHNMHELQRLPTEKISNSAASSVSANEANDIEEIESSNEDTQGDSGLWSKGSLTSLLLEEEGWTKAEGKESNDSLQSLPKMISPRKSIIEDGPTIIITKVSRFLMPDGSLISWDTQAKASWCPLSIPLPGDLLEIHYRIDMLQLNNCQVRTSEKSIQPESIQELITYKSIRQILALVRGLQAEFGDNSRTESNSSNADDNSQPSTPQMKGRGSTTLYSKTTHLLDEAESDLLNCLTVKRGRSRTGTIAEVSATMNEYFAAIGTVDSVIRSLSKDQHVCSSSLFQEFLLDSASSVADAPPDLMTDSIEQYVRQWLRLVIRPTTWEKAHLGAAIALRHRLSGPVLSMMSLWLITHFFSMIWSLVSGRSAVVHITLDRYVTLIALAFYLGHNKGSSSRHSVRARKSKIAKADKDESFYVGQLSGEDDDHSTVASEDGDDANDDIMGTLITESLTLSSPLPQYPDNGGITCWSRPSHELFKVRSATYLENRVKTSSAPAIFQCRGVDIWITDNAERNIAKHPSVLGGKLDDEDTFIVNFLLPFANFVAYFSVPPLDQMPPHVARVWSKFVKGDQQYRDRKLKMLPIVMDGPWIVQKAVGPGTAPAMLGRDLPLQYYFSEPTATKRGVYEVDIHVASSRIARGILNVVKGHIKTLTLAFAFIIEASEEADLPEQVLATFQVHSLHLQDCPNLPAIVHDANLGS
mmetsp:Transcript_1254/g.2024  ORF Transcript_1254/g.2024 Transcript_1254/m.2024 type:complete len:1059 (+) Transcript_1254:113-3289(+)